MAWYIHSEPYAIRPLEPIRFASALLHGVPNDRSIRYNTSRSILRRLVASLRTFIAGPLKLRQLCGTQKLQHHMHKEDGAWQLP